MPSSRLGAVALIAAGALWAQLVLMPTLAGVSRSGIDPLAAIVGLLALSLPMIALALASRRERVAVGLMLAGFPAAIGVYGLAATRQAPARFDVASRILAAATAVAFAIAAVSWARSLIADFPVTVASMDKRTDQAPPPVMRREVFAVVVAIGSFLAVVAPALVSSHAAVTRAERIGGESLVRARDAITSAGGLALALIVVLGAGQSLVRRRSVPHRRWTRGVAFLLWGAAVFGLDWLSRTQR